MSKLRKILAFVLVLTGLGIALFLVVIGPWPVYRDSQYQGTQYYVDALTAIEAAAALSENTESPGRLHAGWAVRSITPEALPALAGYSARPGDKRATGVRDPVEVRVLVLSDEVDTAVLVGADLLIIPPNVAELVRTRAAAEMGLDASNILLNASHTHCGPGGFAPGYASAMAAGPYDEAMPAFLADAMVEAIRAARENLAPARLGSGTVDVPELIRNRTRPEAIVDSALDYLVVEQDGGARCYVVRYSAHPTIFGAGMTLVSAEYPGELVRHLQAQPDQPGALFLSGAVGSMGPNAPEGADAEARVVAMGQALAEKVMAHAEQVTLQDHLDITSAGIPLGLPALQLRPFPNQTGWRLSPILGKLLGLPDSGWFHGIRVGQLLILGLPCDFGGEISVKWKRYAGTRNYELWPLSFNGAYCGYFSPDAYYMTTPLNYETGMMSWYGPDIESYFTALFSHMIRHLDPLSAPSLSPMALLISVQKLPRRDHPPHKEHPWLSPRRCRCPRAPKRR